MKKPVKITLWVIGIIIGIPLIVVLVFLAEGELYTLKWKNFSNNIIGTWNVVYTEKVSENSFLGEDRIVENHTEYDNDFVICFTSAEEGYFIISGQRQDFTYSIDDKKRNIVTDYAVTVEDHELQEKLIKEMSDIDVRIVDRALFYPGHFYSGNFRGNKVKIIDRDALWFTDDGDLLGDNGVIIYMIKQK